MDDQLPVTAWRCGHPAIEFNRGRQHKAVIIVGVFANQIHAAWRTVNARGRPKMPLESVQKLEGCFQRRLLSQICFRFSLRICERNPGRRGRLGSCSWLRYPRSEEHTSELQSPCNLVCRLLL